MYFISIYFELGKPLFEMCWFYVGLTQIALDTPPSVKWANKKKSVPNHPGKPFTPRGTWEKIPKIETLDALDDEMTSISNTL